MVRSPILNNQLTTAGPLNPVVAAYFKLIPLPNNTSGVASDGLGNYNTNAPSVDSYSNEFGRLDYKLGSRDHIFTTLTATNNNYLTPASTLSNPFPNGFATAPDSSLGASTFLGQSISFLASNEHDPYSERYNLGLQHELTSSTLLEMLYVGNHSLHLPIATQNLNATRLQYLTTAPYRNQALATSYSATVANPLAGLLPNGGTANGATVPLSNRLVPFTQFGTNAVTIENHTIGQSYFNSGIAHLEQRTRHGLTLTANFCFAKLTEAARLNDQDKTPTHRISPFDHTYHFTVGSTYELPLGKGKGKAFGLGGSHLLDEVFGGFVVNAIYQFQTGAPVVFTADIPLAPGATLKSAGAKAPYCNRLIRGTEVPRFTQVLDQRVSIAFPLGVMQRRSNRRSLRDDNKMRVRLCGIPPYLAKRDLLLF